MESMLGQAAPDPITRKFGRYLLSDTNRSASREGREYATCLESRQHQT